MIRPLHFRMNTETVKTNHFQKNALKVLPTTLQAKALQEFDTLVLKLKAVGVNVIVINDTPTYDTPDAIFPNNWISFHQEGTVVLYPMLSENRRKERREDILDILEQQGFLIENVIDFTSAEAAGYFLEGTGSLVLDRVNQKAYAAISERTDEDLVIEFCEALEYTPVIFTANQTVEGNRMPIYHTNVMMCVTDHFAMVCLNAIDSKKERKQLLKHLKDDGKEIINISQDQVQQFAGNMLAVLGDNDQSYLVMSTVAYECLTEKQRHLILKHSRIVHSDLYTIEAAGGGSARCMLAEVFLPSFKNINEAN